MPSSSTSLHSSCAHHCTLQEVASPWGKTDRELCIRLSLQEKFDFHHVLWYCVMFLCGVVCLGNIKKTRYRQENQKCIHWRNNTWLRESADESHPLHWPPFNTSQRNANPDGGCLNDPIATSLYGEINFIHPCYWRPGGQPMKWDYSMAQLSRATLTIQLAASIFTTSTRPESLVFADDQPK